MSSRSVSPENDIFSLGIVPERETKVAATSTTDFDGFLESPLLLHEDLKDGCGGQLWPAGMTLAKYMLKYHHDMQGKSILEIGAGGGLVGLAVAVGCVLSSNQKVLITDQLPMLSLMQRNITMNSLNDKAEAQVYDWGSSMPSEITAQLASTTQSDGAFPDVVLAADCVYFEPAFPLLLQTLKDIIGPQTVCYFCFKKRRKADLRFIREMRKTFMVNEVEYEDRTRNQRDSIHLFQLAMKPIA